MVWALKSPLVLCCLQDSDSDHPLLPFLPLTIFLGLCCSLADRTMLPLDQPSEMPPPLEGSSYFFSLRSCSKSTLSFASPLTITGFLFSLLLESMYSFYCYATQSSVLSLPQQTPECLRARPKFY